MTVRAVPEAAVLRQAFDIGEDRGDALTGSCQGEGAQPGGVDEHAPVGERYQLSNDRRVPPLAVAQPDLARGLRLFRLLAWAKRSRVASLLYRPLPGSYQREHLDAIPAGIRDELAEQYAGFLARASRLQGLQIV